MNITRIKRLWELMPAKTGCHGCGKCCTVAPHTKQERYLIDEYCRENGIVLSDRHGENWRCPALSDDNRCTIYPVRPTICRLFAIVSEGIKYNDVSMVLRCHEHEDTNIPQPTGLEWRQLVIEFFRSVNNARRPYLLGFTHAEFEEIRRASAKDMREEQE